ncbi:MAG TPA: ester cyclase [Lacibacter sp.]|nr:ester cyclase [Lacibacter sp.]
MHNEKTELVKKLFTAWNRADVSGVINCYDKEFTREDLSSNKKHGHEQLEQIVKEYLNAFPDIRYEIEKLIEKDQNIIVCWRANGHHKAKLMGIPATGKFISFTGVSILEIRNGKIQKVWYMWDEAGMLRQMGMLTELKMDHLISERQNHMHTQQPGQRA